ncbi:hypothetical protein GO495_12640 [Chitinophaga oryziterrae]|uniref:Uncharacterized protein n=1 Tax=Chitinophaga oryziterrae TaxID=1031224 RepID=A0A6N8JAU0_9BACT|nr:hypothetical protein [Chitinophaga oryziterrae]MVT41436.1 hypothetical protein [Chitinophaga oryziterrae]
MTTPKAKKAAPKKKAVPKKREEKEIIPSPETVSVRMYCIGTGDCFILKFYDKKRVPFIIMIDCGSCRGDGNWFTPYVKNLEEYVENHIDLLIVTHEHEDHVNGFAKCADVFKGITFKEAWFAWTENPKDPGGAAEELQKKRTVMRTALQNAIKEIKKRGVTLETSLANNVFKNELLSAHHSFVTGLDSLAEINLNVAEGKGNSLAGMSEIKEILKKGKTKIRYLKPGETVAVKGMPDVKFHVLGPPMDREYIFKDGKEGTDVYKRNSALNESILAANAFNYLATGKPEPGDMPFTSEYLIGINPNADEQAIMNRYTTVECWRKIDDEWLQSAGSLALRLNSHINNTSLALAIESVESGRVLLFPGDAEYGSWESWHLIENWKKKGSNGKHLVEDLLNRTAFYKVAHHLSYNGTALQKGINMMPSDNLVVMATLDRDRISDGWKTTMPNDLLVQELIRKTGGRCFIMNEKEVDNAPSLTLDPESLDEYVVKKKEDGSGNLYKQYTLKF